VLDSLGFVDAVRGLPEQLAAAHAAARDALAGAALPAATDLTSIAVLGMGGSGISGDVLAAAASHDLCLPVQVHKQIRTPAYIGPRTLVLAVSYSGDTEETVSMARGAIDAGAPVIAISSGGELARLATESGALHLACPGGYRHRSAIGALVALTEDPVQTVRQEAYATLAVLAGQGGRVHLAWALQQLPPERRAERLEGLTSVDRMLAERLQRLFERDELRTATDPEGLRDDAPWVRACEEGMTWDDLPPSPPGRSTDSTTRPETAAQG